MTRLNILYFSIFVAHADALAFRRLFNRKDKPVKQMQPLPPDVTPPVDVTLPYAKTHKDINNLIEQNKHWVRNKKFDDPEFFDALGGGHAPNYMWIGCADARMSPNVVMGTDVGSIFVHRNVANMVVGTDVNLMGALQYGVNYLEIPHIIVCGHYDCGGVRASMKNVDHDAPLQNWLRNIKDVYRLHRVELDSIADPEDRHRRLVELNVVEQCLNLFKTSAVQSKRVETYEDKNAPFTTPRIHACVFDPKDGLMRKIDINFKDYVDDLGDIYNVYAPTQEVEVAPTQEVEVAPTQDVQVAPTQEVQVAPTKEVQVAPTQEVQVARTQEVQVAPTQEVQVAPTQEVQVAPTQEVQVAPTQEVEVTPAQKTSASVTTDPYLDSP